MTMRYVIAVLGMLTLLACKNKNKTDLIIPEVSRKDTLVALDTLPGVQDKWISVDDFNRISQASAVNFHTLECDGNGMLETPDDKVSFGFKIRMVKDSIIWIQMKKLGLEGIRVLADHDSLAYIDRIHRTYTRKSWKQLQQELKAPVDFDLMQQIFTGNPPIFKQGKLKEIPEKGMITYALSDSIEATRVTLDSTDLVFAKMFFANAKTQQELNLKTNYKKILYDNVKFSYLRDLEIVSNKKKLLYVLLEFTEVRRNQAFTTPFDIPAYYRKTP
jgi:hypothetical protein